MKGQIILLLVIIGFVFQSYGQEAFKHMEFNLRVNWPSLRLSTDCLVKIFLMGVLSKSEVLKILNTS